MLTDRKPVFLVVFLVAVFALSGCGRSKPKVYEPTEVAIPPFTEWTFYNGEWEIVDGKLTQKSTASAYSNTNAYVALEQKGKIHEFEWTIDFITAGTGGGPMAGMHILAAAGETESRGPSYLIFQDRNNLVFYRTTAAGLGPNPERVDLPVQQNETHHYRVVVDTTKGRIDVYRDDEHVLTRNDPEIYASGSYISARTNRTEAAFYNIKYTVYN